jgi:hypothetical protein
VPRASPSSSASARAAVARLQQAIRDGIAQARVDLAVERFAGAGIEVEKFHGLFQMSFHGSVDYAIGRLR